MSGYLRSKLLLAVVVLLVSPVVVVSAFADVNELLENPAGLIEPQNETVVRVSTAKVLLVDYPMIRRDFPVAAEMTDQQIDDWLLDRTAYVSKAQAGQTKVNTKIAVATRRDGTLIVRTAIRPQAYNRALVYSTGKSSPLIDSKGTGSRAPSSGGHSNGLATTGEALREFIFQKKVQQLFDHSRVGEQTVGCYGVVDLGFDVIHDNGSVSSAGYVLRQAHVRLDTHENYGNTFVDRERAIKIESALRRYGMTSSGEAFRGKNSDIINIQGNAKGEIVDFGSYLVREKFKNPAFGYIDRFTVAMFEPGKPGWVDPDPKLRLPFDVWGYSITGKGDPKADNIWIWSHELAEKIRKGQATRHDVWVHYQNMMNAGADLSVKKADGCVSSIISAIAF